MANLSKSSTKLERQAQCAEKKAQRKVGKEARNKDRQALRQLRLQQKHELHMRKVETGYYHYRAAKVTEGVKAVAETFTDTIGRILG